MDTVRIRMRLVCFVKWNNLNDCEIGSHSSHLCRSQGLAHVVQRDHFSSQGLLPFGNRLSWSPVSHYLAPHCLTRIFPFEPRASHLNIAYYFSTFTEFPSLYIRKEENNCVCVWCAHAHSPVSVCICIHVRSTNNHICTSSPSPCEMGSCLLLYAGPVGLSLSHLPLDFLNPGLRVCVTASVTEP